MTNEEGFELEAILKKAGVPIDVDFITGTLTLRREGHVWVINGSWMGAVGYPELKKHILEWLEETGGKVDQKRLEPIKLGKWEINEDGQRQRSLRQQGSV